LRRRKTSIFWARFYGELKAGNRDGGGGGRTAIESEEKDDQRREKAVRHFF
jgi:hypothetical protein